MRLIHRTWSAEHLKVTQLLMKKGFRMHCSFNKALKHTVKSKCVQQVSISPRVSSSGLRRSLRISVQALWIQETLLQVGTGCPQTVSCFAGTAVSEIRSPGPGTSLHCCSVPDPHLDPTGSSAWQPCLWHKLVPPPSWARGVSGVGGTVTLCWIFYVYNYNKMWGRVNY